MTQNNKEALEALERLKNECENHFSEVPNMKYEGDYSCQSLEYTCNLIRQALTREQADVEGQ